MKLPSSHARRPPVLLAAAILAAALAACSSSSSPPASDAGDLGVRDRAVGAEGGGPLPDQGRPPEHDGASPDQGGARGLPEVPQQSGVVYVGHFLDSQVAPTALMIYRTDGPTPRLEKEIPLGANRVIHDMALDPYADLLFLVHDVQREVVIYQLSRPAAPDQPVADPSKLGTVDINAGAGTTHTPRFVLVNPLRQRLYVFASPPLPPSGPVKNHLLYAYDISVPSAPQAVAGGPYTIPVTTSMTIDPAREVLFLVEGTTDTLHGFDLAGDQLAPLPGAPIDLRQLYPEEQQGQGFQARNLIADPWRNRLYAARQHAALSELIVIEYPAAIPAAGQKYGELMTLADLKRVQGPFDLSLPHDQRPNLIGAYQPLVDLERGDVLMSALAWNGSAGTAIMVSVSADLKLGRGCDDFEGFGCWYRSYTDGQPGSYLMTDGAACVDYTHRIAVGTSLGSPSEEDRGRLHMFKVAADMSMSVWLPEGGGNLKAGALPIGAVCH